MATGVIVNVEPPTTVPPEELTGTWITIYKDGHPWPVVLCGDSIPPKAFIDTRHNDEEVAAILLGKRKFIWVYDEPLEEYDPNYDYVEGSQVFEYPDVQSGDDQAVRAEKDRQSAFRIDAPQLRSAHFWANVIVQTELASIAERDRKRKRNTSYRKRRANDYGASIQDRTPKKQMNSFTTASSSSSQSHDDGYFGSPDQVLTPKASSEEHKQVYHTKTYLEDSDDSSGILEGLEELPTLTIDDAARLNEAFSAPRNNNSCVILIGPPPKPVPMVVNRRMVHECEFLAEFETKAQDGNHTIDLSALDITPKQFMPVFDFFRTGKIGPDLYSGQFSVADVAGDRKGNLAEYLATAFVTALKIHHTSLQSIIFNKINALSPVGSLTLMVMALTLSNIRSGGERGTVENNVRDWLVYQIVQSFWSIARDQTDALQRLFARDQDMAMQVFRVLAKDPQAGQLGLDDG